MRRRTRGSHSLLTFGRNVPDRPRWGIGSGPATAIMPFAVYYGWPSYVNGARGDVGRAVAAFDGYGLVVLGDDTATPQGDPLAAPIMAGIAEKGADPYGYVTLGVTHDEPNHSLEELCLRLEAWRRLGAQGVLFDCAGADYGVSRTRFDITVEYAHDLGLRVLANAWNPDDILANSVTLGQGDGYLGENDVLSDGQFLPLGACKHKLAKMAAYKADLGIMLYETATSGNLQHADALAAKVLGVMKGYPIDAFQLTDPLYSCTDNFLINPPAVLVGKR